MPATRNNSGSAIRNKNKTSTTFKNKNGAGLRNTFNNIVSNTKKHIRNLKPKCKKMLTELAYAAAQELASDLPIKIPRVIPVPKTGGFLPLIPIFAGLSAAGSLAGGITGIRNAVKDFKSAKKQLADFKKHNVNMKSLCFGKGLHLKPYKNGLGIYVAKKKNEYVGYPKDH